MSQNITHEGVVIGVDGQFVTVQFVRHSACSGCHAKALCSSGSSESEQRTVVARNYGMAYEIGEPVRVAVSSSLAWSAVIVAFCVPLALALISLFVMVSLTGSEMLACGLTLVLLALYYLVVWLLRDRLERRAEFTLERY